MMAGTALVLCVASTACGRSMPSDPSGRAVSNDQEDQGQSNEREDQRGSPPRAKNFVAHLTGGSEVPARDTRGVGQFKMRLSADGASLEYRLIASNIRNVVASHIHIAPVGENGPVVAFLFGPAPAGGGRTSGVLARGTITADDLTGPLEGHPLSELIDALDAGDAYVNAHTNDGVDPANAGPGDFPGGEIRGQIRTAGPTP
jgi:hypothetical protein